MNHLITCKECRTERLSRYRTTKFCSDKCRGRYNKRNRGEKRVCIECGNSFKHYDERKFCSMDCMRRYESDLRLKRENELLEEKKLIGILRLTNSIHNIIEKMRKCNICGASYVFKQYETGTHYCGEECKLEGRRKNKRKNRVSRDSRWRRNGKADYSITLNKLHRKEDGVCYLCGGRTDYNDFIVTEEGHIITGDKYPSIDHVIPIAKGGLHQWNNVKLSHRKCNYIKGDNEVSRGELSVR